MTARSLAFRSLTLLAFLTLPFSARAQAADSPDCAKLSTHTADDDCRRTHLETRTIYLQNVTSANEANEILVALRNMIEPEVKLYLLSSSNAIVIDTYPQEFQRIEALVHTLDKPRKTYRVTYTIATVEDGKNIGTQHFAFVTVDGQRASMKEGDKVPVATGSFSTDNNASQTQFTYLDVGMNFEATVNSLADGVSLQSKVEQSSIGPTNTIAGVAEPVVRQSVVQSSSIVLLGKPVMLGSIDIPNSTRRLDVDVMVESLK